MNKVRFLVVGFFVYLTFVCIILGFLIQGADLLYYSADVNCAPFMVVRFLMVYIVSDTGVEDANAHSVHEEGYSKKDKEKKVDTVYLCTIG